MASFSEGLRSLLRPVGEQATKPTASSNDLDKAVLFQMRALESFSAAPAQAPETTNNIDAILQQRYQDGFVDGQKMAAQDAERTRLQESSRLGKTLNQRIESLCTSFEREFLQQEQAIAESLLELALEIAAKVLADQVKMDRELALPIVRECLGLLPKPARNTQMKVNPADLEWLRERLAEELGQYDIELVADEAVEAGGCMFSNEQFEMNSSLSRRWRETLAALGHVDRSST